MIKSFRRMSHVAKATIASHDPDIQRLDTLGEQMEALKKSVQHYCKALGEYNKSALFVNEALETIYPASGNLNAAVRYVSTNNGALRAVNDSPNDLMNLLLAPLGELETLRVDLKSAVMYRLHMRAELEHYTAKVQKLTGRTSEKEIVKLESNRVKLKDTTESLKALEKDVNDRLAGLEGQVCLHVDSATASMLRYQCEFFKAGVACYEGAMALSRMKTPGAALLSPSLSRGKEEEEYSHAISTAPPSVPMAAFLAGPAGTQAVTVEGGDEKLAPPPRSSNPFAGASSSTVPAVPVDPPSPRERDMTLPPPDVTAPVTNSEISPASVSQSAPLTPEGIAGPLAAPSDGIVLVKAIAPYVGTSEVDVSFQTGDLLLMTSRDAAGVWAHGRIGDTFGDFSVDCVTLNPPYTTRKKVNAQFEYTGGDSTELSFFAGDSIGVISDTNPSWWLGVARGRIGYFPSNYVN